jgi:hypothetical protein
MEVCCRPGSLCHRRFVDIFVLLFLKDGCQTSRLFRGCALRIEDEKAGQDLVLEFRRPVEPGFSPLRTECLHLVSRFVRREQE